MSSSKAPRKHPRNCLCTPCLYRGMPNTDAYTKDAKPLAELPDILKYDRRSIYLPPRFYCGWIINPAQIFAQAERLNVVQVFPPPNPPEDDDDEDRSREEEKDDSLTYNGEDVDIAYTAACVACTKLQPHGIFPHDGVFTRAVNVRRKFYTAIVICDNYSLNKMPSQDVIEQVKEYMSFTGPPQWFSDCETLAEWQIRGW